MMLGRFLNLFLILGVLFASTGVPALAHVHGGGTVHAIEMLDAHHAEAHSDADKDPSLPDDRDEATHHHHCFSGTAVTVARLCDAVPPERASVYPASIHSLASLTGPPPTEPPSA